MGHHHRPGAPSPTNPPTPWPDSHPLKHHHPATSTI